MKKFILFAVIVVSAVTSQAAYLWWQIENQTVSTGLAGEWATAYLYARDLTTGAKGDAIATAINRDTETGSSVLKMTGVEDKGVNYGYYVELMSSDNKLVGYTANSGQMTYSALVTAGSITSDNLEVPPPAAIWHGGTVNAPEPTSAMLMLLGVAGLALRRKQRKIA